MKHIKKWIEEAKKEIKYLERWKVAEDREQYEINQANKMIEDQQEIITHWEKYLAKK